LILKDQYCLQLLLLTMSKWYYEALWAAQEAGDVELDGAEFLQH
jgi:hypothetical protein